MADLLARDGVPAGPLNIPQTHFIQSSEPSERKKGIRRGAKIVFFSLGILAPIGAASIVENEPGFLFVPLTLFLAGIFWMIYYRLFGDENAPAPKLVQPPYFGPPPQNASFPPPQSAPVYRPPVEAPKEHSVVEHTTRSLERQ